MEYSVENNMDKEKIIWDTVEYVSFSHCIYYPFLSQIEKSGKITRLNTKEVSILHYLIENAGNKCHKKHIINRVWNNPSANKAPSFHQYLTKLRKYLGDVDKPHSIIIKTSAQSTYMLTPEIVIRYNDNKSEEVNNKEIPQELTTIHTNYNRFKSPVYAVLLCVSIAFILMLILGIVNSGSNETTSYRIIDYRSETAFTGKIDSPTISPDGSTIIFSHRPVGKSAWDLVAKHLTPEQYVVLLVGENGMRHRDASFSPSGKKLAWIKNDHNVNATCRIMIADFDSLNISLNNVKELLDCSIGHYGRAPQWRTENRLLVSLSQQEKKPRGIVEINLDTLERTIVTNPKGKGYGEYAASINRDANALAYLRQLSTHHGAELRLYHFDLQTDTLLKTYKNFPYSVTWFDSENIFIKDKSNFDLVSLTGNSTQIQSNSIEPERYPFFISKGKMGVVTGEPSASNIAWIDLASKTSEVKFPSISSDYRATIAKGSGDVAFVSSRNGKRQIFVTTKQGITQLTKFEYHFSIADIAISRNGQLIAVRGTNSELMIFDRKGEKKYNKQFAMLRGIHFSIDGKSLLYGAVENTSNTINQLSLIDFSIKKVTTGFMPREDKQGNLYFFRFLTTSKHPVLHKMTPDGNITVLFDIDFKLYNSNYYDVMNNTLYYVEEKNQKKTLVSRDLSTGEVINIIPVTSNEFSLNHNATQLVTTKPGIAQNNLASFRVVQD